MVGLPDIMKNQSIKIKKKTCEIWLSYKVMHLEDDLIHVFVPRFKNTDHELIPGEDIQVVFSSSASREIFDSVVQSVKGNVVSVSYPKQSMQIQERKYIRVNVNIPVIYTRLRGGGAPSGHHRGIICDLSEDGAKLETNVLLDTKTKLKLMISLPGDTIAALEEEQLTCKVMHHKEVKQGKYVSGLKFTDISPEQRQKILKFVLNTIAHQNKNIGIEDIVSYFELANL